MLSYYDFEGLDVMYPRDKFTWKEKAFTRASTSTVKNEKIDKMGYEVLIMNFDPDKKKETDDFWD